MRVSSSLLKRLHDTTGINSDSEYGLRKGGQRIRVRWSHDLVFRVFRKASVEVVLIIILGFLPVIWFKPGHFIAGGDFFPYLNPEMTIRELTYAWGKDGFGGPSLITPLLFLEMFFAGFRFLGFSLPVAEMVLFGAYFSLSGMSMYVLANSIVPDNRFTSLCAALIYMFSFFSMRGIWAVRYTDLYELFIYAAIPLSLGLYVKGLAKEYGLRKAIAFATIAAAVGLPSFMNPVYGLLELVLPAAYFIWLAVVKRKISRQHLVFTVAFLGQWLLVNAFWVLPDLYLSHQYLHNPSLAYIGLTDVQLLQNSSAQNLFETLRLSGEWALRRTIYGDNVIPWAPVYYTPLFIAIGLLYPILAFGSMLLKSEDKDVIFFTIVAAFSVFAMAGVNSPGGNWIPPLLLRAGMLTIFRSTWSRFGYLANVSYSILIARSLWLLSRTSCSSEPASSCRDGDRHFKSANRRHVLVGILLILLIGVYPWPFWTGAVIPSAQPAIPSSQVNVPQYYTDAANWLSSQSDNFYVMSLPVLRVPYIAFTWQQGEDGYFGTSPDHSLLQTPILVYAGQPPSMAKIAALISSNTTVGIPWFLSLMNVKYLIVHEDVDKVITPRYSVDANVSRLERILDSTVGLKVEQVFGKLRFYRNEYWTSDKSVFGSSSVLVSGPKNDPLSANVIAEMSFFGVPAVMTRVKQAEYRYPIRSMN